MSFREPVVEGKVRGNPEKFAEHYNQATLFWNSQSEVEKAHILRAFRFELTRVQVPATAGRGDSAGIDRRLFAASIGMAPYNSVDNCRLDWYGSL